MRLQRMICLAGLLMVTSLGCCHSRCVSSDPCNPCGQGISGGGGGCGCGFGGWLQGKLHRRCHNYSWGDECGCSVCGGDCGAPGATYGGGPDCGCAGGQTSGYAPTSTPAHMVPPNDPPPVPIPSPTDSKSKEGTPAPASNDTTSIQHQHPTGQVQHVSVEEFHRLPGVVTSGPTASSVPTMAAPGPAPTGTFAAPALSTSPKPLGVQQAQWVPAR